VHLQIAIFVDHLDAVLQLHPFLDLGEIFGIDFPYIFDICLEYVRDVQGPELLFSEILPRFRRVILKNAIVQEFFKRIGKCVCYPRPPVLFCSQSHQDLKKFEPTQGVSRVIRYFGHVAGANIGRDKGAIDCRQIDILV
jgi:hypothetical protein